MRYLLFTLLVSCGWLRHSVDRANIQLIGEGIECAQDFWGTWGFTEKAVVDNIMVGSDTVQCGPHGAASTGCWDPTFRTIYIQSGDREPRLIVGTAAHEWSHAMWAPFAAIDPTDNPEFRWADICEDSYD